MTIPAVGSSTALTWALEVGDVKRSSSIKKAIGFIVGCVATSRVPQASASGLRFPSGATRICKPSWWRPPRWPRDRVAWFMARIVQFLLVIGHAGLHQHTGDPILQLHGLLHQQIAIPRRRSRISVETM